MDETPRSQIAPHHLTAALGAILALVSVVLLPWICFGGPTYFDSQFQRLRDGDEARWLLEHLPLVAGLADNPALMDAEVMTLSLANEDVKELATVARSRTSITGFQLWREVRGAASALRAEAAMSLLLAAFVLIWTPISMLTRTSGLTRYVPIVYGLGCSLALLIALWLVPLVDTFGIRGDILVAFLAFLSGARTGVGYWLHLVALFVMILGAMLAVKGAAAGYYDEFEPYAEIGWDDRNDVWT